MHTGLVRPEWLMLLLAMAVSLAWGLVVAL
jgi:hypothetical protein